MQTGPAYVTCACNLMHQLQGAQVLLPQQASSRILQLLLLLLDGFFISTLS